METFDDNDYISDSNSESSFSEHSMQSEEDVMSDTEPDNAVYNDIDLHSQKISVTLLILLNTSNFFSQTN